MEHEGCKFRMGKSYMAEEDGLKLTLEQKWHARAHWILSYAFNNTILIAYVAQV